MRKKVIISLLVILVLVAAGFTGWYFLGSSDAAETEEIAYVTSVSKITGAGASGFFNRFSGVVESQDTWDIQLNQEMTVEEIYVEEGDAVEVDTPLFIYDTDKLSDDLSQAELDIERIDADIVNLRKQIETLEKEKRNASADDKLAYTTEIQTAEMDIKRSEFEKKSKEVEIEQIKKSIDNAIVHSQVTGVVKSINEGNEANYNGEVQPFMSILETGDYRIKGKVNEYNLSSLAEGMPVIVHSRIDDEQKWAGTVSKIDFENPSSGENDMYYSNGGESSNSYPFYIALESAEDLILGQHVYIEMDAGQEEEKEGLWLAEHYIVTEENETYVWAANDKERLEKRKVVLGLYDDALFEYQILEGLTLDDYIAIPSENLTEGMPVEITDEPMMSGEDDFMMDGDMYDEGMMDEGMYDEGMMDEGMYDEDMLNEGMPGGDLNDDMNGADIIDGENLDGDPGQGMDGIADPDGGADGELISPNGLGED